MKYLIIFCFTTINMNAQVRLVPQINNSSCWAASLAMVSSVVDARPRDQYHFIKLRCKNPDPTKCLCSATTIPDEEMVKLTELNIDNYKNFCLDSLGLHHIEHLFINKKPIIYDYKLNGSTGGGDSHIVVMDMLEKRAIFSKNSISWIRLQDPWPKNIGNVYFLSYEMYYSQKGKYTISYSDDSEIIGVDTNDDEYLSNVLFNSDSDSLVQSFLDNIKAAPDELSDSFYKSINIDKSLEISVSKKFRLISVGNDTRTSPDGGMSIFSIDTFLSSGFETIINFLFQNETIKAVISMSKVINSDNKYAFNNNWIINHIESGEKYQMMSEIAKKKI